MLHVWVGPVAGAATGMAANVAASVVGCVAVGVVGGEAPGRVGHYGLEALPAYAIPHRSSEIALERARGPPHPIGGGVSYRTQIAPLYHYCACCHVGKDEGLVYGRWLPALCQWFREAGVPRRWSL